MFVSQYIWSAHDPANALAKQHVLESLQMPHQRVSDLYKELLHIDQALETSVGSLGTPPCLFGPPTVVIPFQALLVSSSAFA